MSAGYSCATGCNLDNDGVNPPAGRLNFPIALATSSAADGAPSYLFVANSNFNLAYNAGTIQSFDLARLNDAIPESCIEGGCGPLDPAEFVVSEVLIPAFTSGMTLAREGQRLYATVRSDASLVIVDVADGRLGCGAQLGDRHRCDDDHLRGRDGSDNERELVLPNEPTGLAVGALQSIEPSLPADAGDYVVVSHRGGAASLFLDRPGTTDGPILVHVLDGLLDGLSGVAAAPNGTFWLPSNRTNDIPQVGVALDQADPQRSFLFDSGAVRLFGADFGRPSAPDIRSVAFHSSRPDRAYLLARRPEAMLFADLDGRFAGTVDVDHIIPLGVGPSRFTFANVFGRDLLFASCFDSRDIFIIDLELEQLVGVARGFSGPFDLVVDAARQRLYVADFRSSVIRVVSLAPMVRCGEGARMMTEECSPRVLAVVGTPRPVEELR